MSVCHHCKDNVQFSDSHGRENFVAHSSIDQEKKHSKVIVARILAY